MSGDPERPFSRRGLPPFRVALAKLLDMYDADGPTWLPREVAILKAEWRNGVKPSRITEHLRRAVPEAERKSHAEVIAKARELGLRGWPRSHRRGPRNRFDPFESPGACSKSKT